jgi:hypothetical protein
VAAVTDLDLYLALERLMIELDQDENPAADDIRDLIDPIWFRLPPEDIARLDARGLVDPRALFPVQLPLPPAPELPTPTIADRKFNDTGWEPPADWRKAAA